jgi:hypothetical protein
MGVWVGRRRGKDRWYCDVNGLDELGVIAWVNHRCFLLDRKQDFMVL